MSDIHPIRRAIARVRLRLQLQKGIEWGVSFAVFGLLISLVATLLGKVHWVELATAERLLVVGLFRPVSPLRAAKLLDISHQLKDRFSSALEFSEKADRSALEDLTIQEA